MSYLRRIASERPILLFVIQAATAFVVGTVTYFCEAAFYHTAFGGPLAVLVDLFLKPFVISALATLAALCVHGLTQLPGVRKVWQPIRYITPILIPIGFILIIFASRLGLRHTDAISNFKSMEPAYWWTALFLILFPIVNFPLFRSTPDR